MTWYSIFIVFSMLAVVVSFLPLFTYTHWVFRTFDYIRLQLLALLGVLLIIGISISSDKATIHWVVLLSIIIASVYHLIIVLPFIVKKNRTNDENIASISFLSVNVLQKNTEFDQLIAIINEQQPDILLTMETNQAWQKALEKIEPQYAYSHKIPQENRYGMHLYTNLQVVDSKTHHLISEEHPSIQATMLDFEGKEFIFWGVHPPPPSPTEKPTSKQKDGELMQLAKLIDANTSPTLVAGDFNSVCWSRSSRLFAKIANLNDARLRRGVLGTFPAQYKWLRFPVDLVFHSESILITKLTTLRYFGSDHLPIFSKFYVCPSVPEPQNSISSADKNIVKQKIIAGKKAATHEND